MKPLSHEELTVSGSALNQAAKYISQHTEEAKRLIEELPSKNMFASSESAYIDVKFATADELQSVLMQVFKGRLVVHTEAIAVDARPQVEATAMLMTSEGMLPVARSTAGVQASHEFVMGQKAFLSAETRAIRKVLNHLDLLPEDEAEDPMMAKIKSTKVERSEPEYLEPVKDPSVHDCGADEDVADEDLQSDLALDDAGKEQDSKEEEVESKAEKKAPATKKPAPKKTAAKKARASKPKAAAAADAAPATIPDEPLDITLPTADANWPDMTALTYVDTLSRGVKNAFDDIRAKQSDFTLELFIRGVMGKDAQSNYSRLSLKRLRIMELEKLYAYYVCGVRPEKGGK